MHVWRGELQPDALRPVEHVFASQPGAPYSQKKRPAIADLFASFSTLYRLPRRHD
jgi:hypothetical protein